MTGLATLARNMSICARCELLSKPCSGAVCFCTVDRIDVKQHAIANACPHPDGSRYLLATVAIDLSLITAVPRARWPLAVRAVARLATAADVGAGDTIHRLLARLGGDAMARFYKKVTGQDCGCDSRQARLNALFPYEKHRPPV